MAILKPARCSPEREHIRCDAERPRPWQKGVGFSERARHISTARGSSFEAELVQLIGLPLEREVRVSRFWATLLWARSAKASLWARRSVKFRSAPVDRMAKFR